MILSKIKDWLDDEVKYHQPVVDGEVVLSDGTDDICIGRHECAEGLLNQIKIWEEVQNHEDEKLFKKGDDHGV